MHSATGWSICGSLMKWKTIGNFHDFKQFQALKKSQFWPFLLEKLSKIHKIGDFVWINHQNLKHFGIGSIIH